MLNGEENPLPSPQLTVFLANNPNMKPVRIFAFQPCPVGLSNFSGVYVWASITGTAEDACDGILSRWVGYVLLTFCLLPF